MHKCVDQTCSVPLTKLVYNFSILHTSIPRVKEWNNDFEHASIFWNNNVFWRAEWLKICHPLIYQLKCLYYETSARQGQNKVGCCPGVNTHTHTRTKKPQLWKQSKKIKQALTKRCGFQILSIFSLSLSLLFHSLEYWIMLQEQIHCQQYVWKFEFLRQSEKPKYEMVTTTNIRMSVWSWPFNFILLFTRRQVLGCTEYIVYIVHSQ